MNFKNLYSHFFKNQAKGSLHFCAHSHHPWPDISLEAHNHYWLESVKYTDKKWESIFCDVLPQAQKNIATLLGVSRYEDVFFAQNTHELIIKIFSCLGLGKKKINVLTTNGEFHSIKRQLHAWYEMGFINIEITTDINNFSTKGFDVVFMSHVFFETGLIHQKLTDLYKAMSVETIFIIDGYHAVGAIPIELPFLESASNVFYIGGGYKYLQAGEGCCFALAPNEDKLKPFITGWFAEFGNLDSANEINFDSPLYYGNHASRYLGATFDPSGIYRFNAVYSELSTYYSPKELREYIMNLKNIFCKLFRKDNHGLKSARLMVDDQSLTGSFISLYIDNAEAISNKLREHLIYTDARGPYLRFGFGIYQNEEDIRELFNRLLKFSL